MIQDSQNPKSEYYDQVLQLGDLSNGIGIKEQTKWFNGLILLEKN